MTKLEQIKNNVLAALNELEQAKETLFTEVSMSIPPPYEIDAERASSLYAKLEEVLNEVNTLNRRI